MSCVQGPAYAPRVQSPAADDRDRLARGVVSVFSGGGGLDLGLETAGFQTLAAVELDAWACWTLRTNQAKQRALPSGQTYLDGTQILERDVRAVSGAALLRRIGAQPGQLGLLCGGPPCVPFSVAGPREGLTSETGRLFEDYARLLRVLRPRAFVFENVRGLLTAAGAGGERGGAWPSILERLRAAGYRVSWRIIDAADFGVPQHRERIIVVGLRGMQGPLFSFPAATHGPASRHSRPWATVWDALRELPPAASNLSEAPDENHVGRAHTDAVRASFAATPQGRRNDRFKRDRLRWDRPAKVVRAQGKPKRDGSGGKHSSHQAIHPEEPRQLTVRECARIQSFPDWYSFPPTFCNGYRVVGDAVPPLLAAAVGHALIEQAFAERAATGVAA